MAYVPNAQDIGQPTGDKPVASAAPEFRTLKAFTESLRILTANFQTQLDQILAGIGAGNNSAALAANLAAAGGSALVGFQQTGVGATLRTVQSKFQEYISVFDYMTVPEIASVRAGTMLFDNTVAVQNALNAAGIGRSVFLPKGMYKITATLVLSQSQKLVGESKLSAFKNNLYLQLSTLNIYTGQGGTVIPAMLLDLGSGVEGICFNYPNQAVPTDPTPIQFGWAIATDTSKAYNIDDVTIRDIMFVNAYMGISLDKSGRFNVSNVYGDCIKEGIFVDRCFDVGRMTDVHIWTFTYGIGTALFNWIAANGRAFNFNRADEMVGVGLFQYGRNVGFDFNDAGNGAFWGDFFGCISDVAHFPLRITKAARIKWVGGTFIPYLSAEPCITTSADISTVGQGTGFVAFYGVQFHDIARCGAVITSTTGNFDFTDCDFERAEITVINNSGAYCSVQNAKTRFGTAARLTAQGPAGLLTWNGISNPSVVNDVSPANFNMATFVGGTPTSWAFRAGANTSIANQGGGTVRLLFNSAATAVIGYNLPTNITQKMGTYNIVFTVRYASVTDGRLTIHSRRNDLTNSQSIRVFDSFNHVQTYLYIVPVIIGYDTAQLTIDIEWSSPTGPGAGYAEIANLAFIDWPDSQAKQDSIDSILRREFLDPFGYGAPVSKAGSNRIIQQALNAPAAGTWKLNDRVVRYPPAVGQPKGWVCTAAGTPGTWVSEGNL